MDNSRKKTIGIILVAVALLLVIGSTYAFITFTLTGTKKVTISAGTLSLVLDEKNEITISDALPMYDEVGMIQDKVFTFDLINETSNPTDYTLKLQKVVTANELQPSDVKYYLTKDGIGKPMLLSTLPSDGTVDRGTISGNDTIEYTLRLWIDSSVTSNYVISGKSLSYKINVEASQNNIVYHDESGANIPELAHGMIPVTYNETEETWVKADTTEKWYDYDNQMWANAVTVTESSRESYMSAKAGASISMEDINTMWVWIPRYSYSIKSEDGANYYGKGSTNKSLPGEIDVKFIKEYEKESGSAQYTQSVEESWLTHPAFSFGEEELTGLWVGKFETGGYDGTSTDASLIKIKPDIQSWRNMQVSNMFTVSRKLQEESDTFGFSTNVNPGLDSHMLKNSEWGSVAFLTQSKYGKYGNSDYTGANKEVYINNSSSYYTGRSGGSYSGNTQVNGTYTDKSDTTLYKNYGFYSYDDYLLDYSTGARTTKVKGKGTGASTTGNIYGVYDMSGGTWEYVMANHQKYSGRTARSYTVEEAPLAGLTGTITDTVGVWNSGFNGAVFGKDYNSETGKWDIQMYVTNGTDFPDEKYYNLYTTTNQLTACDGKPCKGESYETGGWYSESWEFGNTENPWVNRGGGCSSTNAGVFSSNSYYGHSGGSRSFRFALVINGD